MTFLSTLAEYTTTVSTNSNTITSEEGYAAIAAVTIASIGLILVAGIIAYILSAIFLSRIFKKAGVDGWIAWVPFYNTWKLLELGGQQGFWAVLAIVPIINYVAAVFMYIAMYHIGKKLGKDGTFVLLAIFVPIVWIIWLAVDKSKWNDKASTAPSLAK